MKKQNKANRITNKKNIYLVIGILSIILVGFPLFSAIKSYALSTEIQSNLNDWQKLESSIDYDDLKDIIPTFTNVEITTYFTPNLDDYQGWCSPKKPDCFTSTEQIKTVFPNTQNCVDVRKAGWCCIPEADRGFYEDVKCQGSGVANGKVYLSGSIRSTPQESKPESSQYVNGITKKGTDPMPKRTIAVNPKAGTMCHIPYWTNVYIYFGENNPWNGVYLAEDTGSAFSGACKIDVYVGSGQASLSANRAYINDKTPVVYLLSDEGEVISSNQFFEGGQETKGLSSILGTFHTPYAHSLKVEGITNIFEKTKTFAQSITNKCSKETNITLKHKCVLSEISTPQNGLELIQNCPGEDLPKNNLSSLNISKRYASFGGIVETKMKRILTDSNGNQKQVITLILFDNSAKAELQLQDAAYDLENNIEVGDYVQTNIAVSSGFSAWVQNKKEQIFINPDSYKLEQLKRIATDLADCATSNETTCLCEINSTNAFKELYLQKYGLSFDNFREGTYVEVDFPLLEKIGLTEKIDISNKNNISFYKNDILMLQKEVDTTGIDFTNIGSSIVDNLLNLGFTIPSPSIQNVLPALNMSSTNVCIPQKKHYLMCSNIPGSDSPPLRFALKI